MKRKEQEREELMRLTEDTTYSKEEEIMKQGYVEESQSHAEIERGIEYMRGNYDVAYKKVVQNGAQAMEG